MEADAHALPWGSATAGACTLLNGGCVEMTAAECTTAGGRFDGLGSFCPTTCVSLAPAVAPVASRRGLVAIVAVLVLAAFVTLRIRRT